MLLQTPPLVLDLISKTLDNDIFLASNDEVTGSALDHRYITVLQNGSPRQVANPRELVSDPEAGVVAIVERDANLQAAAKALLTARFSLGGESPYAPDLVLVNEWVKKGFLVAILEEAAKYASANKAVASRPTRLQAASCDSSSSVRPDHQGHVVYSSTSGVVLDVEDR